jgi:hypothetical protein
VEELEVVAVMLDLDQATRAFACKGLVLKPVVVVAVKGRMDSWVGVRIGIAKLAAVVESELVMTAEEGPVAVSQELEHIYLVVERLMEAHCKVMALVR